MAKKTYRKLVRDRIPVIILKKGSRPRTHIASNAEFIRKLNDKLIEESKEYVKSGTTEELADLLEVIYAISALKGLTKPQLERARRNKATERGSFSKRIILDYVIE
jgi:predicted house-cleaning noncanonical NTP pyrophosphatase (MazG superfamily)